jgi:NCS1 family nucleobase:cation symporter-1
MLVDYFLLRRGNLTLADMYTASTEGMYYYVRGANIRAFVAFVVGFLLPLPGFVKSFGIGSSSLNEAASNIYALGWELSFLVGGITYYVLGLVWPVPGDEREMGFETAPVRYEVCESPVSRELEATSVDGPSGSQDDGLEREEKEDNLDKSPRAYEQSSPV